MAKTVLVKINYIDGTSETVEAVEGLTFNGINCGYAYDYTHTDQIFSVCLGKYCMMISR